MKGKVIAVTIVLAIIFGGGYLFSSWFVLPFSIKETRNIWAPEQFHIANNFDGSSLIVSEYKNDVAKKINFEDLLTLYNSSYTKENFTIIAQQNGTIWYKWSFNGEILKAACQQDIGYTAAFPREGTITDISRDGPKAYIMIVFNYSWWEGLIVVLCFLGIIALGLFVGWIIYPRSKSTTAKS